MTENILSAALLIFVYMTLACFLSVYLKDASIVDIAWGIGFILVSALINLLNESGGHLRLVSLLILIWATRLSAYILIRKIRHPGEDWRYKNWRQRWGKSFAWRSFLQIFMLQGLIMLIISLPVLGAADAAGTLSFISYAGAIIWITGFLIESIADYQKSIFKKNNPEKIITSGLWRYSRHPNYFGESLQWWGIWLAAAAGYSYVWTVVSPLLLTYLLLFVSGVPMLEKKYQHNPDFIAYKKKTSVFLPWFPGERKI